jgi:uncharacterized protein YjbI with pentapeptide repeats
MANEEKLNFVEKGKDVRSNRRKIHSELPPDLSNAYLVGQDLSGEDLSEANLRQADLTEANLSNSNLIKTDLSKANLYGADLRGANLGRANLRGANLSTADLSGANLNQADLSGAFIYAASLRGAFLRQTVLSNANLDQANLSNATLIKANLEGADLNHANLSDANLRGANLSRAILVKTNLTNTLLRDCRIYGISAWDVQIDGTEQINLIITPEGEPTITVDNLKIAQFIYLLLNNAEIREVIDTIARKAVLILGRFAPPRKAVLDALREALRTRGYLPILFDFDKPSSQDLTETVSTLAHLSRFIIVDLTDPSSAPYEVGTIASNHIKPIQAIFHPSDEAKRVFAMFPDLVRRYHWVLAPYVYQDQDHLLATLKEQVIEPAEQKAQELEKR